MHAHILTIDLIRHFVEAHAIGAYFLIFAGVIVEGEIMVILSGVFAHIGAINIYIAFLAILLGGISKSLIGYSIGRFLRKRHSHHRFIRHIEHRITYFFPRFKDKPFWSIFISRFFILGLNWFTLIFSGFVGVSKKMYAKAEIASLCVWSAIVFSLGFFFSVTALSVSHDVRKFLLLLLLFFIGFFILQKLVAVVLDVVTAEYRNKE